MLKFINLTPNKTRPILSNPVHKMGSKLGSSSLSVSSPSSTLMWFRKGLRIHDNPALYHAANNGSHFVYPVFVIDPHYMEPDPDTFSTGSTRAGLNRIRFLLESLEDLDFNLRKIGSRLLVLKGEPGDVLLRCFKQWNIKKLCFEYDTDPYYQALDARVQPFSEVGWVARDGNGVVKFGGTKKLPGGLEVEVGEAIAIKEAVIFARRRNWPQVTTESDAQGLIKCLQGDGHQTGAEYASSMGIDIFSPVSHTLFDPREIINKNGGKPPLTYQSFLKLAGQPSWESSSVSTGISSIPPVGHNGDMPIINVPTVEELGYNGTEEHEFSPFKGGESEALARLKKSLDDKDWVAKFEKPKGDPSSFIKPATTVLSPYLKFGCLSVRYFYQCLQEVYRNVKHHTSPPVSLVGQLLWRDFFYTTAFGTPNFNRMKDNRICKQIPWNDNSELFTAWRDAKTGYPWIDAIMVQLRKWGWMHHLARHCVACFLTRGDLFIHWEKGRDVFERLLIDSDWAINNGNWLWLSCSSFFYEYHRIYSPISFGKKYDPNGNFIRHFLPVLKDMPKQYIYEPWTAPMSIQVKAKCIIGKDYPSPVVYHDVASKECKRKLAEAYALNRKLNGSVSEDYLQNLRRKLEEDQSQEKAPKRLKQKLIG